MQKLIINTPGKRGLTKEGEHAFKRAYESSGIFENEYKPIVRFPHEAVETIRQVSELRKREWRTTSRWNFYADQTGLLGEIATQKYMGMEPDAAINAFLQGLTGGDHGHDLVANGLKLDVKSTKGTALKVKFSKTNRYSHLADGYIFAYVESAGMEFWIHLHGWAHRADVKPFLRDDGQRFFVRVETLRREGLLKPVRQLKHAQESNPLITIKN